MELRLQFARKLGAGHPLHRERLLLFQRRWPGSNRKQYIRGIRRNWCFRRFEYTGLTDFTLGCQVRMPPTADLAFRASDTSDEDPNSICTRLCIGRNHRIVDAFPLLWYQAVIPVLSDFDNILITSRRNTLKQDKTTSSG